MFTYLAGRFFVFVRQVLGRTLKANAWERSFFSLKQAGLVSGLFYALFFSECKKDR